MPEALSEIASNLRAVEQRVAAAAGDRRDTVTLIAVSKAQPDARVDAALAAGHRVFGENRVQEAIERWRPRRSAYPDLSLHLVGPLQTNKVTDAVALFDVIHSVDRSRLATKLADAFAAQGRALSCFVQVNTGEEPQKAGVAPHDADDFIAACRRLELPVAGLMCIPPFGDPPAPHFALLRTIAARNGLSGLSMGMSGDFETALRLGATHVRVGTAIFGTRPPRP